MHLIVRYIGMGLVSVGLVLPTALVAGGWEDVDYKNIAEVRARFKPKGSAPMEWTGNYQASRASSYSFSATETRWHDRCSGQYVYSDWSWVESATLVGGTIVALPTEDFHEEESFTYIDSGSRMVVTGKFVTVTVGIYSPGKEPSGAAKMRTVKNLCESGMNVPAGKDFPAGRIVALKDAAKMRFGASAVDVYYNDHASSKVGFLLFKCDSKKARQDVRSIYFNGRKR